MMVTIMKKVLLALLCSVSVSAIAGTHTITGGYAHSHADGANLDGFNIKYGYQFDNSPWGIIASLTGTTDKYTEDDDGPRAKTEATYASLTTGVSYNVYNDWKFYGTIGRAGGRAKYTLSGDGDYYHEEETRHAFAYGAGIQFTPVSGFTLDAGYERAHFKTYGDVGTWTVGAGWKF